MPSVSIRGEEYPLKITSTAYLRLAVLIRPIDGSSIAEIDLSTPEGKAKFGAGLAERLADDITTRRLAYALRSICPGLEAAGLVRYEHLIRMDDTVQVVFDVDLEVGEILDIAAIVSKALEAKNKQKPKESAQKPAATRSRTRAAKKTA
jgi:hypothetical protein